MPRALTEEEKAAQRQRLLDKGRGIVLAYGIKRVSVDDITKAAGLAKGTFYHHFDSKEQYLCALVAQIHREAFSQAERIIFGSLSSGGDLRANVHEFLRKLFSWPEMIFFIQNEPEIEMIFETVPNQELLSFKQMEAGLFEGILRAGNIDIRKVKPGVVHNFIHALFLMKSSEYMSDEDLQETADLILESLVSYILGGAK